MNREPKPNGHQTPSRTVEEIAEKVVEEAYRKFGRDRQTRKAVEMCFAKRRGERRSKQGGGAS